MNNKDDLAEVCFFLFFRGGKTKKPLPSRVQIVVLYIRQWNDFDTDNLI